MAKTATAERKASGIDGQWAITWRPEASTPHTGTATLTTGGEGLKVELDSTLGSGTAEGTVEGNRLSWTITLGDSPSPLQFAALIEDDEISGSVQGGPGLFGDASLEGTRVGSKIQVRSREGSDALAETLKKCGVEYVFGYLEGYVFSYFRGIVSHDIPNMAGRTELSAAWMSYGYNRVKRRAASAIMCGAVGEPLTSPVVYAAKLDSTPLLFLPVEHAAAWNMRELLQDDGELYSMLKPISKYIKRIVDAEDLPLAVRQAVMAASTGKFGPAVLNLTYMTAFQRTTIKSEELILPSPPAASEADVTRALEMIKRAKNPVLLVGAGVHAADAAAELRSFAEAMGIPVVSSAFGGRGVLPDDHPLYAGGTGLNMAAFGRGKRVAEQADLWIAIGYSFSQTATDMWTTTKPDKVIHVDVEGNQIGRIFQPTLGIVADAKVFLSQLNAQVKASGSQRSDYLNSPRIVEIQKAKELGFQRLRSALGSDPITPLSIGAALTEEAPEGALIVGDEAIPVPGMVHRESKYPSGMAPPIGFHLAHLGSTLPVAIGAKLAEPDRVVISYGGDAGFYYDCMDLSILAQHDLKVIVIINNNYGIYGGRRVGMFELDTSWIDLPETSNFATVAKGFGVEAERVEKSDQLVPALRRAVAADGPYLLDVQTDTKAFSEDLASSMKTGEDAPKKMSGKHVAGSWPS